MWKLRPRELSDRPEFLIVRNKWEKVPRVADSQVSVVSRAPLVFLLSTCAVLTSEGKKKGGHLGSCWEQREPVVTSNSQLDRSNVLASVTDEIHF